MHYALLRKLRLEFKKRLSERREKSHQTEQLRETNNKKSEGRGDTNNKITAKQKAHKQKQRALHTAEKKKAEKRREGEGRGRHFCGFFLFWLVGCVAGCGTVSDWKEGVVVLGWWWLAPSKPKTKPNPIDHHHTTPSHPQTT